MPAPIADTRAPTDMIIHVLSPEEEAALRERVEAELGEEDEDVGSPESAQGRAGNSAVTHERVSEPEIDAPAVPEEAARALPVQPAFALPKPLPSSEKFEAWLYAVSHQQGMAALRRLAHGLGGDGKGGREELVGVILRLSDADPARIAALH